MTDTDRISTVLIQRPAEHVALVTLNRPEARNAINGDLAHMLDAIVSAIEDDPSLRVAVITGAGLDFCAGADLKAVSRCQGGDALRSARGGFAGFVDAPRAKPWIAAVNGRAFAGGCEIVLAMACQIAGNAPFAVRESLRVARAAIEPDAQALRDLNAEAWARITKSEDAAEGPRAFAEISPGPTETPLFQSFVDSGPDGARWRDTVARTIPRAGWPCRRTMRAWRLFSSATMPAISPGRPSRCPAA